MAQANAAAVNPSLRPSADLAPPGGCRGAVSGWRHLIPAIEAIEPSPLAVAALRDRYGQAGTAAFGGPAELMRALASNPMLVQGPVPPAEIYAHFIWYTGKVAAAAQTIAGRLAALPSLWDGGGATDSETGGLIRQLLGNWKGLAALAASVADEAEALLARLNGLILVARTVDVAALAGKPLVIEPVGEAAFAQLLVRKGDRK